MEDRLARLDAEIRSGRGAQARHSLAGLRKNRVPRRFWARVAAAATRAGIPELAIRWLHPLVRSVPSRAEPEEIAQYALALIRIGSAREAEALLAPLDPSRAPNCLLYRALALVARWDYEGSLEPLRRHVSLTIDSYQRLVGEVNLLAALVHTRRFEEADELSFSLLDRTRSESTRLLQGTVLHLCAESHVLRRQWGRAEERLARSEKLVAETGGKDPFYVEKWRSLITFLRAPFDPAALAAWESLRTKAIAVEHWETVRDCDLFRGVYRREMPLLAHVFFGTPHPAFRARIRDEFGIDRLTQTSYLWAPAGSAAGALEIDSGQGALRGATAEPLRPMERALLRALASDFYAPFRIPTLFAALYPGEFYHPTTSAQRVHQVKNRLSAWFKKSKVPLRVEERNGWYRLQSSGAAAVRVYESTAEPEKISVLSRLRGSLPEKFTAAQIADALSLPKRSAQRWIQEAIERGWIVRDGAGRTTRYRVANPTEERQAG